MVGLAAFFLMELHLLVDGDDAAIKINAVPRQPKNLTFTDACEQSDNQKCLKAVSLCFFQKGCDLFVIKGRDFCLLDTRQDAGVRWVKTDIPNQHSLL